MHHAQQIACKVFLLLSVQSGGRLVQRHKSRLCREGTGEADQLLNAVRHIADELPAIMFQLEKLDDGLDALALLRRMGLDFGMRELGFKTQLIGHTETGIATVIRDFLPAA